VARFLSLDAFQPEVGRAQDQAVREPGDGIGAGWATLGSSAAGAGEKTMKPTSLAHYKSKQSEADFLAAVVGYAHLHGWLVYHTHDSRFTRGSDPGFPDLVFSKLGRVVFCELKVRGRKPTVEQANWLATLGTVEGVAARVWWPTDWQDIEELLGP